MKHISLLLFATLIWGLGFAASRWTFSEFSPTWSNALRFLFAGGLGLLFLAKRPGELRNKGAIISAAALGLGLQLQTVGISQTTLAKSGFLTVFYALFTPILMRFFFQQRFRKTFWALVCSSMFGIAMLCEFEFQNFNQGDLYILASALVFSVHILCVDRYARDADPFFFNAAQCVYIGLFCLVFAFLKEGSVSISPLFETARESFPRPLVAFLILSLFSSHLAFGLQIYAQKKISAHIVGLIFLMESIFSALFGWLFFQEHLSVLAFGGCFVVMGSVALIPRFSSYSKKNDAAITSL